MKPAPFKYLLAESLEHALTLKAHYGDAAKFLAGGQSLIPAMNFRVAQPSVLIDINPLEKALGGLSMAKGDDPTRPSYITIGAMTRYRTLEHSRDIAAHCPLLHEAIPHVAHPQIRNRGTIGGNLAHADPASEITAVMLALNAKIKAQSATNTRWINALDFFVTIFTTTLQPDEMLTEIAIPTPAKHTGTAFIEVARRHGDYALMGVATLITVDENNICTDAKLSYLNAGDKPVLASQAIQCLVGNTISQKHIKTAAKIASEQEINPTGNVHASVEYQRHLAGVLTQRALTKALAKVNGANEEAQKG